MDDFVRTNLNEARNEWCSRLVSTMCPLVIEGIRSIFAESWKVSIENKESEKYLMTFQNFLCRIPKWNQTTIEDERKRIIEKSGCNYLEDLITCVHIIQLKILTCVRVGHRQKKIDISIPKLDDFVHKVYINTASKVYRNAYIFDKYATALQQQRHARELEIIVEECILKTIRDSIPTEAIVRAYLDESVEHEEEIIVENAPPEPFLEGTGKDTPSVDANSLDKTSSNSNSVDKYSVDPPPSLDAVPAISNMSDEPFTSRLTFNDIDTVFDNDGREEKIEASKSIPRLEEVGTIRALERKMMEEQEDDNGSFKIVGGDDISLDLGAMDLNPFSLNGSDISLDDIEDM
jgi:hypothetical protein